MVSSELTELGEGTVEYKPEPKAMEDRGNGAWTKHSVKIVDEIGDVWYDCSAKVYNAVQKGDKIKFTYSTNAKGFHKIADLVAGKSGGYAVESEVPPAPQSNARPTPGMIGTLPGAEVGAMENRAKDIGIALGIADNVDEMKSVLMNQAYLGSWFKAQQIPSLDDEPIPLQDDEPEPEEPGEDLPW